MSPYIKRKLMQIYEIHEDKYPYCEEDVCHYCQLCHNKLCEEDSQACDEHMKEFCGDDDYDDD